MKLKDFTHRYETPPTPHSSPELLFYAAFTRIFGVPKGLLSKTFRDAVSLVLENKPLWRRSASHAIWKGILPDIPVPYADLAHGRQGELNAVLFCLDVLDTMVGLVLEKNLTVEFPESLKAMREAFGQPTLPKVHASLASKSKPRKETSRA